MASAAPVVPGDVTGDGLTRVADAVRVVEHVAGVLPLSEPLLAPADIVPDRSVDGPDLIVLRGLVLGRPLPASAVQRLESSPTSGEGGVAVTRETVLSFARPLADDLTIGPADVFARFGGAVLASHVHVAPDRRRVTLFYDDPLPPSARVRVTVLGARFVDVFGLPVDVDGDGQPGGDALIDFDTLTLTTIPGTAVFGRVWASELAPGPDGGSVNVPLEGVTVTVDGMESTMRATTNEMGDFRLEPAPAGRFFVHIDGRTATNGVPEGGYYPFVGKAWSSEPGIAKSVGDIYLPLVQPGTLQPVSATEDMTLHFAPSVLAAHPEMANVAIRVPADSLYADDGTRGGRVGIAPVPPDRIPGRLPEGLKFPIVITVQTDGATNFDVPVPACFPNLPDRETGRALAPGVRTALWSFNHDTGEFEVVGPMTVTEDGTLACTDVGVGILAPGWHGQQAGSGAGGDGGGCGGPMSRGSTGAGTLPGVPQASDADGCGDPCQGQWTEFAGELTDCALSIGGLLLDSLGFAASVAFRCGLAFLTGSISTVSDCGSGSADECGQGYLINFLTMLLDCIGKSLWATIIDCTQAARAYGRYRDCTQGSGGGTNPPPVPGARAPDVDLEAMAALFAAQNAVLATALGDARWGQPPAGEESTLEQLLGSALDAAAPTSPEGMRVSQDERDAVLGEPRPSNLSEEDVAGLLDRLDAHGVDEDIAGMGGDALLGALDALRRQAEDLVSLGWGGPGEGAVRGSGSAGVERGAEVSEPLEASFYYALTDEARQLVQRGRTANSGRLPSTAVVPAGTYRLSYLHPSSLQVATTVFIAPPAGTQVTLPLMVFGPPMAPDNDGDGLADDAEYIVDTDPSNPDTDGDGINDAAEIQQGLNPLDGLPARTGIVATVDVPGTAVDVCVGDNTAVVANLEGGVTVLNVFNGLDPTLVAQISTPAPALRVACAGRLVAAAVGNRGLSVIDVSDPPAARIVRQVELGAQAQAVAADGGIAFVGLSTGDVAVVDLTTGRVLARIALGNPVEDIALGGDYVYVLTSTTLRTLAFDGPRLQQVHSVASPTVTTPNVRLFVGTNAAYAVHGKGYNTFSLANPAAPALVTAGNTAQFGWRQIAFNGAGLAVAAVDANFAPDGPGDVSLYVVGDGMQSAAFQTTFQTPGYARAVTIANGLAYVADGTAGVQVVNYVAYDSRRQPPTVGLASAPDSGPVEADHLVRLTATVSDDVQVRNVEFFVDGVLAAIDGSYPFEVRVPAPHVSAPREASFTARAFDTGGNATTSAPVVLQVMPDSTPPQVVELMPPHRSIRSISTTIRVVMSEPMDAATVEASGIRVAGAGPDGISGSADDVPVAATITWRAPLRAAFATPSSPLSAGRYVATVSGGVEDLAGNQLGVAQVWRFVLFAGADVDDDGMPDAAEAALGLDPSRSDSDLDGIPDGDDDLDGDGLSNAEEAVILQTDPARVDSNGDTIPDGAEDADHDGLTNVTELHDGTDPVRADTDGDGTNDGSEVLAGCDPLVPELTTLVGRLVTADLAPFPSARVSALGVSLPAVMSGSDGRFSLPGAPGCTGARILAEASVGGRRYRAASRIVPPASNGVTDLGDIVMQAVDESLFPAPKIATGLGPKDAAIGDVNGDGRLDAAVVNFPQLRSLSGNGGPADVSVFLGDGAGGLARGSRVIVGSESATVTRPAAVALADVTGDGLVDIVASEETGVSLLPGRGDGTFGGATRILTTGNRIDVTGADLDRDGDIDLAFLSGSGYLSVLRNHGDGTFDAETTIPRLGDWPVRSLAVADVDGNDDLDLVGGGYGDVVIVPGRGDGTFEAERRITTGCSGPPLTVADIDADGDTDIVTACRTPAGATRVALLRGDGVGGLAPAVLLPSEAALLGEPLSVAIVDADSDGRQDVVVSRAGFSTLDVMTAVGDGTFRIPQALALSPPLNGLIAADLNGDGRQDLLGLDKSDTRLVPVLAPDFIGPDLASGRVTLSGSGLGVVAGDFDRDGRVDLATGSSWRPGRGDGTFDAPRSHQGVPSQPRGVAVADVDADSWPDLIVASQSPCCYRGQVSVLRNAGNGSFEAARSSSDYPEPLQAVTAADFDADGLVEVAATSQHRQSTGTVTFEVRNDASVVAVFGSSFYVGASVLGTAFADLDGDADLDGVGVNRSSPAFRVALNNGNGTFQSAVAVTGFDRAAALDLGDIDRDGHVDVVACESPYSEWGQLLSTAGRSDVLVARGLGGTSFAPMERHEVGAGSVSVAVGDVNGDGLPDIVSHNAESRDVSILVGQADGTLAPELRFAAVGTSLQDYDSSAASAWEGRRIVLTDLDGDGKLDIVLGERDQIHVMLHR